MSKLISNHVYECINRLKENMPKYYDSCLKQRLSNGIGSTTDYNTVEEMEKALLSADWEPWDDYFNVLAPGCSGFITKDITGHHGMISLTEFPPDAIAYFRDPKDTGYLSLCIPTDTRTDVDYTILITGSDEGIDGEVMFTFHPGEPEKPSTFKAGSEDEGGKGYNKGDSITVAEALELGFRKAKAE